MKATHLQSGEDAESMALSYLKANGLSLVMRNYSTRSGEIDLIMLQDHDLVFAEVRYRRDQSFGGAAESVNRNKQRKIRKTAEIFLQKFHKIKFSQCRFDVIAITGAGDQFEIDWIKHAF